MKKLKYIIVFILSVGLFNSCLIDNETDIDLNASGKNLATFTGITTNFSIQADGEEHLVKVPIKMAGPTIMNLTSDITVTVAADASSTAVANTHYRIETPTITLTKANNYLGNVEVTIITAGNEPLEEGDPGYEDWLENYKSPVLVLEVTGATGDANVTNSGKALAATINFVSFCFFAGDYDVEMKYFHPTAGGSYPTDPYGGVRELEKTMTPLSSKKCETWFGVWDNELCSWELDPVTYEVVELVTYTWSYATILGDPYDATNVGHWDEATGKLYLYYHYYGSGGPRVFWEVMTPKPQFD